MKKVVSLVGARPQFIKEAVIGAEVRRRNAWKHILVHSGQHYDANMSDVFFQELDMKQPDHFLGVGSGSHAQQTADDLVKFEALLLQEKPDMVLVYGDTNTTVAGALAASKLKIPVAHVEAGIRQQPKDMPEEINRVLVDHISAQLFCCSDLAARNLAREGITNGVTVPGDVMYDLYLKMRHRFTPEETRTRFGLQKDAYIVATIHRDFNTDDPRVLAAILDGLDRAHKECGLEILLPLHPRTRKRIAEFGLKDSLRHLRVVAPIGYLDLMSLTQDCVAVVTDSGGYQKEAYYAGKRAVVLMPDTGWRELVEEGWNLLCDTNAEQIAHTVTTALAPRPSPKTSSARGMPGRKSSLSCSEPLTMTNPVFRVFALAPKIFKSSLFRAAGTYGFFSLINRAIPFFLLPVMTRYLTPEDYGMVAVFGVMVSLLIPFVGMNAHGAYSRAYFAPDRFDSAKYMGTVIIFSLATWVVVCAIFGIFRTPLVAFFTFPSEWMWAVPVVALGTLLPQVVQVAWQVREQPRSYGIFQNARTLSEVGGALLFVVLLGMGWQGRVLSRVFVSVLFACSGLHILVRKKWLVFSFDKTYLSHALCFGIPLIPHTLPGNPEHIHQSALHNVQVGIGDTAPSITPTVKPILL